LVVFPTEYEVIIVAVLPDKRALFNRVTGILALPSSDAARDGTVSAFSASLSALSIASIASIDTRYAGFLSTFITRGRGLPDASIVLQRKRLAAAASRLAVRRRSIRLSR
jgi:hypothetical protein